MAAIALMVVVGLGIGHVCGGPARKNRRVLAMATATRHPALAMAIGDDGISDTSRIAGVVIVLAVLIAVRRGDPLPAAEQVHAAADVEVGR